MKTYTLSLTLSHDEHVARPVTMFTWRSRAVSSTVQRRKLLAELECENFDAVHWCALPLCGVWFVALPVEGAGNGCDGPLYEPLRWSAPNVVDASTRRRVSGRE